MRAVPFILVAASLLLSSCGGRPGSQAKSAAAELKPRDLIVGTWTIKREDPLDPHIQGYEFAADNTMKVVLLGAKEPITGKYAFANDYTLEVEYDVSDAARKSYTNAVKAYKKSGTETAKKDTGTVEPQIQGAMAGMFGRIPDRLPGKEILTIAVKSVKSGDKPGLEMIVENEKNFSLIYRKAE